MRCNDTNVVDIKGK